MSDDWQERAERERIDEEGLRRLYHERSSDWFEPGAVKVYPDRKL